MTKFNLVDTTRISLRGSVHVCATKGTIYDGGCLGWSIPLHLAHTTLPRIVLEQSLLGDKYGCSNHTKITVSPHIVTCGLFSGTLLFGIVTATVSVPEYGVLPKEYGMMG